MWLPHSTTIDEMIETHKMLLSLDGYDVVWSSHHTEPNTKENIKKYLACAQNVAPKTKNSIFPGIKINDYNGAKLIYRPKYIHKK